MPDFVTECSQAWLMRETAIAKFKRIAPKPWPNIIYIEANILDNNKGIFEVIYLDGIKKKVVLKTIIKITKWLP